MTKIKFICIILLSALLLGCLQEKPTITPTPTPTLTPTPTPSPTPTPTLEPPTPMPTPNIPPVTYKVWMDSDYGYTHIRATKEKVSINLPSDFDKLNFTINRGDTVIWINDDSYNFQLTIVSNDNLWTGRNGTLRSNYDEFRYTFNTSGKYTFSIKESRRTKNQTIVVNP